MNMYIYIYIYTSHHRHYGLVVLFYGASKLFGSFNTELSHFSLICFYGKSTIVGYLTPNPFLYIKTVLF